MADGGALTGRIDWPARTTRLAIPTHGGVASARNRGLTSCSPQGWVLPLDADDLLDPAGSAQVLTDPVLDEVEWVAANRVLIDGSPTPHWIDRRRRRAPEEFEEAWSAPFPLHPNTVLALTHGGVRRIRVPSRESSPAEAARSVVGARLTDRKFWWPDNRGRATLSKH